MAAGTIMQKHRARNRVAGISSSVHARERMRRHPRGISRSPVLVRDRKKVRECLSVRASQNATMFVQRTNARRQLTAGESSFESIEIEPLSDVSKIIIRRIPGWYTATFRYHGARNAIRMRGGYGMSARRRCAQRHPYLARACVSLVFA